MKCPRCSGNGYAIENKPAIASSLGGEEGTMVFAGHCILCGHHKEIIEPPVRPMPRKSQVTEKYQERMRNFVDRLANGEPTDHAILRCNTYFQQYCNFIKTQLTKGRTFHSVSQELEKMHPDFPKRSWLRKTYFAWIEKQQEVKS